MRARLLLLASALILTAGPVLAGERLPVRVGGRAAVERDGALSFGWPAVYFEGRFAGPAVEVAVDTTTEHLLVSVDGKVKAELKKPGAARLSLSNLGAGEHVVRVDKLTESQVGSGRFGGFFAGPGARALPAPAERARKVEFIGDSHTVGYGVRSAARACTPDEIHDLTDTSLAFGPVLARRLDADYRVIAFSGRGVVRNYDGTAPGEPLPALYPRVIPSDPDRRIAASDPWRPQLIVIGLGTNDFSTPVKPGEPWSDPAALRAAYRDGYVAFVQELAGRQPQARFLLIAGDSFADDVAAVIERINAATPGLAAPVRITGMAATACDHHPSIGDEAMMADRVEAAAAAIPDLWSR